MIALIIEGDELETSVEKTISKLSSYEGNEECSKSLIKAIELAKSKISEIDAISQLGEGWIAEEAIGIYTYCALQEIKVMRNGGTVIPDIKFDFFCELIRSVIT